MTNTSRPEYLPTTQQLLDTFTEETAALGGRVTDVFSPGRMLFARAVFSAEADMRPGDRFSPGIALRAVQTELEVHPYIVRQVCTNGAIGAHALESRQFQRIASVDVVVPTYDVVALLDDLRAAIRGCAANEVFAGQLLQIRDASAQRADLPALFSAIAKMPAHVAPVAQHEILERFATGGDRSAFGLMNAVTSVARDTADPEVRWALEVIGAAIPARARQSLPTAATTEPVTLSLVE